MRLLMMNGGLGNQAFQYIFMRYIEEETGIPCIIDDTAFYDPVKMHNGYELDTVFSIHHQKLSDLLGEDTMREIHSRLASIQDNQEREDIISIFHSCGIDLSLVQEGTFYTDNHDYHGSILSTPANEFFPEITRYTGDLYYYGYWINVGWFRSIRETILKEFTFPDLQDPVNRAIMKQIQSSDSIAVHIRRGDFIEYGLLLSPEFYQMAVKKVRTYGLNKPVFFIFSDDIPWVRQHTSELGFLPTDTCVFIEGNTHGRNYIDMQLMSSCKIMIIANSSFSYLAALLNTMEQKLIFTPTPKRDIV